MNEGHTIYPCLFQIRTSAPSSGTVLTFDKVKLLSLSYVTCCACFRSSNKLSHAQSPCDISNVLTIHISRPRDTIPIVKASSASTTLNNLANNSLKLQLEPRVASWVTFFCSRAECRHNGQEQRCGTPAGEWAVHYGKLIEAIRTFIFGAEISSFVKV